MNSVLKNVKKVAAFKCIFCSAISRILSSLTVATILRFVSPDPDWIPAATLSNTAAGYSPSKEKFLRADSHQSIATWVVLFPKSNVNNL